MTHTSNGADSMLARPQSYLDVLRTQDGRYCVQFVSTSGIPRKSYTPHPLDVVKQAQRAGNIPICTVDEHLRQLCQEHDVQLIAGDQSAAAGDNM